MLDNQQLAGSALITIGSLLLMSMNGIDDMNKLILFQRLSNPAKLIMQIHHNESKSRKTIIPSRLTSR